VQDQTVFASASPQAAEVARLFTGILIVSAVIFVLVSVLVGSACIKFRARGDQIPEQRHGRVKTEIAWTVAPFLLLVAIFVFTVAVMRSAQPDNGSDEGIRDPDIIITGYQWWWAARYPHSGVITANEIHIPVGKKWLASIESKDVIHDFWTPPLGPKIDAVPGHPNYLWLEADSPGTFRGACAEFCGNQHAWMRITVIAETAEAFERWEEKQNRPASASEDAPGYRLFQQHDCINCHALKGTHARADVAPDLTHVASRTTLGAGIVANDHSNLRRWLENPQAVKPGIHMPNFRMTPDDVTTLTTFLESLQ